VGNAFRRLRHVGDEGVLEDVQNDDRAKDDRYWYSHQEEHDIDLQQADADPKGETAQYKTNDSPYDTEDWLLHHSPEFCKWPEIEAQHQEHDAEKCDVEDESVQSIEHSVWIK